MGVRAAAADKANTCSHLAQPTPAELLASAHRTMSEKAMASASGVATRGAGVKAGGLQLALEGGVTQRAVTMAA